MTFIHSLYHKPSFDNWHERKDSISSFYQVLKMLDLTKQFDETKTYKKKFALVGFKSDEGVKRNHGRVGAKDGPDSVRSTLAKFPVHNDNFVIYDAGDIVCYENLEEAQDTLGNVIFKLLSEGFFPIVIGGGHEVSYGHYLGLQQFVREKNLGIVNFDAHLDMRCLLDKNKGSSGTPFLQIALNCKKNNSKFDYHCIGVQKTGNSKELFETAKENNVKITYSEEIHENQLSSCYKIISKSIKENDYIYLTLCLDVFASAFAPGVSAVQPFGLFPSQVNSIFKLLLQSNKIISLDIAELNPKYDQNFSTAKLASTFIYELVHFS